MSAAGASAAPDVEEPRRPSRPLWLRRLRRARRQTRDAALFLGILLVAGVYGLVPLRAAVALTGALVGMVAPWLGRPWRLANAHLAIAFPDRSDAERAGIAREAFANLGRSFAELLKFGAVRRRLGTYVIADGIEHLRAGLTHGRGLMAITGHVGNWELLAAYCSLVGLPVNAIGRRLHSPLLNRLLIAVRARAGVRTILRESAASSRAILRTLRRNEILALLIDQDTRGPRVFVPFFGRPAATPSGVAALARRTGAPVLPLFISRRAEGGHLIRVFPPFPDTDPARDTVESLTAAYTAVDRAARPRSPDRMGVVAPPLAAPAEPGIERGRARRRAMTRRRATPGHGGAARSGRAVDGSGDHGSRPSFDRRVVARERP